MKSVPKRTVVRNNKKSSGADSSRRRNGRDASSPRRRPPRLNHPRSDLEEAIRRYVDLFDFAPVAYVNFDRTSRIAETNLAAIQLLGRSRHLLIGCPLTVFVLSEDRPHFFDHLLRCRDAKGELIETDLRMRNARNEILFVRLVSKPVVSSLRDGTAIYQTAIVDLTERKRQEAQMERQAKLIELSFEPILVWDFEGGIIEWNAGAEALYGYSRAEALGQQTHKLLKTKRAIPLPEFRKILKRDGMWVGELRHVTKDGREILAHSRHQLVEIGGRRLVLETIWDITARKKAEEALLERDRELNAIVNLTPFVLSRCSRDLRYLFVSRAYAAMVGYTQKEIAGQPIINIMGKEGLRTIQPYIDRVLKGERVEYESEVPFLEGGSRVLHVVYLPDKSAKGEVIGWIASILDITKRKRAEEALRTSEEQFRRAIQDAPIPVIMHAEDGQVLQISKTWTELTGYGMEAIPNFDAWLTRAYGEGADAIRRHMQELFKGRRRILNIDFPVRTRDGGLRYWSFSASAPGKLQDGRRYIVGMALDITDRTGAEVALRESEERFRQFAENTTDVFWIITAQTGQLEYLNPAYESMFGETRESLMRDASHWAELIHPDDRDFGADMLSRLKAGDTVTVDYRIIRPNDGAVRWIRDSGFPIRDKDGQITRVAGVLQDITDDKLKTDALRESEERFRLLIEGAPDYAMFLLDLANHIIYWSTGAERVFGWSSDETLGRSGEIIFTPEDRARKQEQKELKLALENGKANDRRWHLRKDGSRVWIDGVMCRLTDEDGKLRGFAKIGRDATDLHQAIEDLRHSQQELESRVQERTAELLAANKKLRTEMVHREQVEGELLLISEREKRRIGEDLHDSLCQELAAAAFFLQSRANNIEQTSPKEAHVLSDAARIVNDNVGLARDLARGLHPVELTASGLTTALRELVFRSCQDKMKCQFKCPNPIRISDEAVALSLYRIAQEAMTNASKNGKAKKVVISLVRSRERVVLSIQDDGKGFSTRRRSKGMGLHLMRYRANSIGARLTVKSAIGKGTTITCSVPAN